MDSAKEERTEMIVHNLLNKNKSCSSSSSSSSSGSDSDSPGENDRIRLTEQVEGGS